MRKGILILSLILLSVAFIYGTVSLWQSSTPVVIGEEVPDFTLETLLKSEMSLSDFKGKPTTLIFFTTWCDSCRAQQPYLNKFIQDYGEHYEVILVNRRESRKIVQEFADEFDVNMTIFLDRNDNLARPFGILGQPEAFFINEDGVLLFHQIGPVTDKFLLEKWNELR